LPQVLFMEYNTWGAKINMLPDITSKD